MKTNGNVPTVAQLSGPEKGRVLAKKCITKAASQAKHAEGIQITNNR
jgi:hypothetical protein